VTPVPAISVVIPTHDRLETLRHTLGTLSGQTIAADAFEVIVVADGCRDDTARTVRTLSFPFRLTVLEQPHAGAAAARNRGAAHAAAPLLLFLDDDMRATPGLLAAHLAAQAELPRGGVVLGPMPSVVHGPPDDVLQVESRCWWAAQAIEWARPEHRFTARDLFAGNVSMPRALFIAAGGFDEAFGERAAEDRELGVRLLRRRVPFRFAPAAVSQHDDRQTFERLLARAVADGRGHVLMARRHPQVLAELPLGGPVQGRLRRLLWELGWSRPRLAALLASALRRAVLPVLEGWRLRGLRHRLVAVLHVHAYWCGVRQELGSRAAWEELRATAVAEPPDCCEREFDLAHGFDALGRLLGAEPLDGLRLQWHETPIGYIAPLPAAEPLRPVHVRAALVQRFAEALVPLVCAP
jgi:GT2 family glycosyltransferase